MNIIESLNNNAQKYITDIRLDETSTQLEVRNFI